MRRANLLAVLAGVLASQAQAQPVTIPAPPPASVRQALGEPLPMDLPLTDSSGRAVHLGDAFNDGRAVLLVLGYYRCPQLCGLVMHDLLHALHDAKVAA